MDASQARSGPRGDGDQVAGWRPASPDEARAIVIGAPFDGTSGGRPRQGQAPTLLRTVLGLVGPTGPGSGWPAWDVGDVLVEPVDAEPTLARVEATIEAACQRAPDALPVLLGGEHTVSLAAVRGLAPGSIVSLDAHPDLWEHQHGRETAQGTWLRRAVEHLDDDAEVVLWGARAARGGEKAAIDELGVRTELPDELPEPVYLTVDVDVFDPEDVPAVVYPEHGGPPVDEVLDVVERVAREHELAGVDVVEVNASQPGPTAELGARVLSRALGAHEQAHP